MQPPVSFAGCPWPLHEQSHGSAAWVHRIFLLINLLHMQLVSYQSKQAVQRAGVAGGLFFLASSVLFLCSPVCGPTERKCQISLTFYLFSTHFLSAGLLLTCVRRTEAVAVADFCAASEWGG